MSPVVIVDSGVANLGSVRAALARLGVDAPVTRDHAVIAAAPRVLLPGVGAADTALQTLRANGLDRVLASLRQPLLGICLGMQLLYERSEEGSEPGLGLLRGVVRRLRGDAAARVPHMGWNTLESIVDAPLTRGISAGDHAYFVHSYAVAANGDTLACTTHGARFTAIVGRGNVYGAQFHPERSAAAGATLLRNFLELPA